MSDIVVIGKPITSSAPFAGFSSTGAGSGGPPDGPTQDALWQQQLGAYLASNRATTLLATAPSGDKVYQSQDANGDSNGLIIVTARRQTGVATLADLNREFGELGWVSAGGNPAGQVWTVNKATLGTTAGGKAYLWVAGNIKTSIPVTDPKYNSEVRPTLEAVQRNAVTIATRIFSLSDTQQVTYGPDSRTMTGLQLKQLLSSITYNIVPNPSIDEPGYGGHNVPVAGGYRVDVFLKTVTINGGYAAPTWNGKGINYLILHELGHDTQGGLNTFSNEWKAYTSPDKSQFYNSDNFKRTEQYANIAGLNIGTAIQVNLLPADIAPFGYIFTRSTQ